MVMPRLLIQELSTKGTKEDHTLVFCHSYVLLSLYQTMVLVLGSQDALYIRRKSITSEKDDTCTTLSVRKNITSSLDSALRVCLFFFHNCLFNWLGLTKYSEGNSWAREWKKWTWRRATVAVMYYGKSGGSGDMLSPEMKHKQCVVSTRATYGDSSQIPKTSELHWCCDNLCKTMSVWPLYKYDHISTGCINSTVWIGKNWCSKSSKQHVLKANHDAIKQEMESYL